MTGWGSDKIAYKMETPEESRFVIIAKDKRTGEEKEIEDFDSFGWTNGDIDETDDITFQQFCDIIKHYLDVMGDV